MPSMCFESLPGREYLLHALSAPITHFVMHADDMVEVGQVIAARVLAEVAE